MSKVIDFNSNEFGCAPLAEKLSLMNTTIIGFVKWCIENKKMRLLSFIEALIGMRYEKFSQCDADFFKNVYFNIKGDADKTANRNMILDALVLQCLQYDLKDFFLTVFKKERNLPMRLTAIRGYSAYATEAEVTPLMDKFSKLLSNNYYHSDYVCFRSKFGLPYLVKHYGYDCFKKTMEQLDEQYEDVHPELKDMFTLDEYGISIKLISDEEMHKRYDAFRKRVDQERTTQS